MTDQLAPEHWQDLDAVGVGTSAASYLDAAAAALAAPRLRSHELLGVEPGATVLDVGCGTGIALREIAEIVGSAARSSASTRAQRCSIGHATASRESQRESSSSRARRRAPGSSATGSTPSVPSAS